MHQLADLYSIVACICHNTYLPFLSTLFGKLKTMATIIPICKAGTLKTTTMTSVGAPKRDGASQWDAFGPDSDTRSEESGICPTCHIVMEIQNDEYVCKCGRIITCIERHISSEVAEYSQNSQMSRRRYYTPRTRTSDLFAATSDHLFERREAYARDLARISNVAYIPGSSLIDNDISILHNRVPDSKVLVETARIYCSMKEHASAGSQSFPYISGNARDELLAAIMFHEGNKTRCFASRDIANMMNLRSDGMGHGHEHLTYLASLGYFAMDTVVETRAAKIRYYYEQIIDPFIKIVYASDPSIIDSISRNNMNFIMEIVVCATSSFIGIRSQLQSKIVGTIWFLIINSGYNISSNEVDERSGGIKKATFTRFTSAINSSEVLMNIARKYGMCID